MATITSFNAIAPLKVSSGNQPANGLSSDLGTTSGIGIEGSGLKNLQIKVTRVDGTGPQWTGQLPNGGDSGSWVADLTCQSRSTLPGAGENTGDPEDVQVTVEVGTGLTTRQPVVTTSAQFTVKIGAAK
jgi:hypothetical protein